jgi:hypothetical protein
MKKKKNLIKDRCKDIEIGVSLTVHLCRDTITETNGFFISMQDKHGNFTGSIISKGELKKLNKMIDSFLTKF